MKFSQWKAITMHKLIELIKKYENNTKIVSDLSFLITKLNYLKSRDLDSFLYNVYIVIRDDNIKELYEIIPSTDEIKKFFEK